MPSSQGRIENSPYRISGLQILPEGVEIAYVRTSDVKENGLMFRRVLLVPFGADYEDELEQLAEAIHTVVADAEDDEDVLEPMRLEGSGDEDDDDE